MNLHVSVKHAKLLKLPMLYDVSTTPLEPNINTCVMELATAIKYGNKTITKIISFTQIIIFASIFNGK